MKTKSFTLIELLVVIVIIGILAGVITLSVSSNISKAQDLKISSTILSISKTLKADSYDSFPIEVVACNLKNSCATLKSRIDLPNITEDIYYKTSSSGKFFVIYANKPSNTSLGFEITSTDENVKEVPSFDNLVAYYPLAVGTANGTAISDMSPNSNNGTNYGASSATGADGNIGTAMSFDGVNDYVDCGNGATINLVGELTLSAWVKEDTFVGTDAVLSKPYSFKHRVTPEKKFNFQVGDINFFSTADAISANVWYLLSGVYDGSSVRLYINETLNSEYSHAINPFGTQKLTIGSHNTGVVENFDGTIKDVRIYNRALSQEEITLLYNK